ncbi:MAG: hypothetical protein IT371_30290 [Deltaproteobacteria bacterium]|nr:hypothetical protein [Deltaproteobacteria bacterium]
MTDTGFMSADQRRRLAERNLAADPNDPEAQARAVVETARVSGAVLGRFVGHWVLLLGVRTHYLGHVVDVSDAMWGSVLWCDEAYDLENVTARGPEGHSQRLSPEGEKIPVALFVGPAGSVGIPPWGDKRGF